MKAKFTKGEWEVLTNSPAKEINNIVRINRATKNKYDAVPYVCIGGFPDTDPKEEIEANAHLIAAAPDMYAMKVETDALTKALSKLGFNADVFMGMYDDHKYVQMMTEEFKDVDLDMQVIIDNQEDSQWVTDNWGGLIAKKWPDLSQQLTTILNNTYNGKHE